MHRFRWPGWAELGRQIRSIRPGPWMVPVGLFVALYLWRPFALGFYSDDWSSIVESANHGGLVQSRTLRVVLHQTGALAPLADPLPLAHHLDLGWIGCGLALLHDRPDGGLVLHDLSTSGGARRRQDPGNSGRGALAGPSLVSGLHGVAHMCRHPGQPHLLPGWLGLAPSHAALALSHLVHGVHASRWSLHQRIEPFQLVGVGCSPFFEWTIAS